VDNGSEDIGRGRVCKMHTFEREGSTDAIGDGLGKADPGTFVRKMAEILKKIDQIFGRS